MPRRLTSHRTWPASPAGTRETLDVVACEIAALSDHESQSAVRVILTREAMTLLAGLARQHGAPTRATALDRLRRLQTMAAALADLCDGLDPMTREVLTAGRGTAPDLSAASAAYALALAADEARKGLIDATAPTPGPGNLADRLWGDPRLALCRSCVRIVASFAGRAACSSSPGGLVHRAAAAVWDYATGEIGEEAGLERYLAQAMRSGHVVKGCCADPAPAISTIPFPLGECGEGAALE